LLVAGLLAFAGCANINVSGEHPALQAGGPQMEEDIPVPEGFHYKPGDSTVNKVEGGRYLDLVYTGSAPVVSVAKFYREIGMPMSGWKFTKESSVGGNTDLEYVKGAEKCEVHISRGLWGTNVRIVVSSAGPNPPSGKAKEVKGKEPWPKKK